MTIRPNKWTRPAWLLVAMSTLSLSLLWVGAQPQMGGKGKNLGFSDYDSQNRISSHLFAKEATPRGNDVFELTGLRVEMYAYDTGTKVTNLIVTTTNCVYDKKAEVATSTQSVAAATGDGKIKVSGIGFRYQQADAKIIVSNQVRIEVSREVFVKKEGK